MSIPASSAREKLFPLIQEVNENSSSILITSKNGNAVLLSESEYESLLETLYLLSTPANAKQTLKGLEEFRNGLGITFSNLEEAKSHFKGKGIKKISSKKVKKRKVVKKKVKIRVN